MSYDYFSKQRIQYILAKLKTIFDTKLNINSSISTSKRFYGVDVDGTQILEPNKYGSYDEIRKHEDYLYEVNYSNLDYDNAYEYFNSRKIPLNTGACSVLKKGNLIGRNFDWTYDENVSFVVHTTGNENRYSSIGMSGGATNLTKTIVESGEFNDAYKIVPFLLVDGVNECGVFIEENVVPQDYGKTTGTIPAVELKESLCSLMVVRFVLDHFATAQSAVEYLRDYTSIYSPKGLDDMHYDVHFFISDKDNTYVIEFVENEIQIIDLTNKNKIMTNFHLYNTTMDSNGKVTINRDGSGINSSGVTANGSGLERYNLIIDNYDDIEDADDMRDVTNILKYTNAYNLMYPNFWYTEFTGINGLDVTSPISDYTTTVEDAAEKYSHRNRDKESEYFGTWQTTHSAVYDLDNNVLKLLVQEGNNEFSFPLVNKISNYVELTKDEYDTLPDSKLTDGIDYYITDWSEGGGGISGSIFNITIPENMIGDTFTISKGTESYTKTPAEETFSVNVLGCGVYTITNTTKSQSIEVNAPYFGIYEVSFNIIDFHGWLQAGGIVETFANLDAVLADEPTVRILMTKHAAADYLTEWAEVDIESITKILNNDICAKWINLRDYALDMLYASNTCKTIMDTADKYFYGEWGIVDSSTVPPTWGPLGNVPVMTSNTAPYGEVVKSTETSGKSAFYVFDNNDSTVWIGTSGTNQFIGYKFINPIKCNRVAFKQSTDGTHYGLKNYKIQYSDDGTNYTDATEQLNAELNASLQTINISNSSYHLYWRMLCLNVESSVWNIQLAQLQFYGRELKVSVPVMTSNTEPWGEAIGSSGTSKYKAFWTSGGSWDSTSNTNQWVGYDFGEPVKVLFSKASAVYYSEKRAKNYKVEYSDNNTEWTTVPDSEGMFSSSASNEMQAKSIANVGAHRYWRYFVLDKYGSSSVFISLFDVNFYGLDYSEHDERHYIYDHGVELEEIDINGYTPVTGSLKFDKSNDNIHGTIPTQGGYERIAGTQNKIDLTDYVLSFLNTSLSTKKEIYIDISSVNSENYVAFDAYDNSGTVPQVCLLICSNKNRNSSISSKDINNRVPFGTEVKIIEMWLE